MKDTPNDMTWSCRIGLLVPHFDLVPEFEFGAMAPEGVSIHAARVLFGVSAGATVVGPDAARAFADEPYVDEATELLAAAPIESIVYGFTSSSYLCGADADGRLRKRLEGRSQGIPVVVPCLAALSALQKLEATRLALVNPPWFPTETDELGARYFQDQGIEVVFHGPAEVEYDALPAGQIHIDSAALADWVKASIPRRAEAVFIAGNGFRAIEAIEPLENALERPVLTANQIALWQALGVSGVKYSNARYGRIFREG